MISPPISCILSYFIFSHVSAPSYLPYYVAMIPITTSPNPMPIKVVTPIFINSLLPPHAVTLYTTWECTPDMYCIGIITPNTIEHTLLYQYVTGIIPIGITYERNCSIASRCGALNPTTYCIPFTLYLCHPSNRPAPYIYLRPNHSYRTHQGTP